MSGTNHEDKPITLNEKRTGQRAAKTFTPIGDIVALDVFQVSSFTERGVALSDANAPEYNNPLALVVACGPDCKWLREGDVVICSASTQGFTVNHDGQRTSLFREHQMLGVVERAGERAPQLITRKEDKEKKEEELTRR
jgi:co-chaperonin GroES (HSP10)